MEALRVEEYINKYCTHKWQQFYSEFKELFEKAPAAASHHHNYTGGLAIHTAEVIRSMFEIRDSLSHKSLAASGMGSLVYNQPEFTDEDLVVAGFLHDFAKIVQYAQTPAQDWCFVEMSMPQETWTLMTLAQQGVEISEAQTLALLYAEGGFSGFRGMGKPNELSWLLHMADIWSSQIIKSVLQLPACPSCGKDMKKRKGPKGYFWGCSGYPVCSTTINIAEEV